MLKFIQNRNFILISALLLGFTFDEPSIYLKHYTVWILATVMAFSLSGVSMSFLKDYRLLLKTTAHSILLNYLIFGILVLVPAYFLIEERLIFLGFVVIAATPPGVAIIPFTHSFGGDMDYSIRGILGSYLSAIILMPLIIMLFSQGTKVNPVMIIFLITKVMVIPVLISRILHLKKINVFAQKIRGKIVNYGFALIIYTAIALNKNVIFSELEIVIKSSLILFFAIFVSGTIYLYVMRKRIAQKLLISQTLMITIKASGFSVASSLALFEQKASIPSAVLSIFILLYLIFLGFKFPGKSKV